MSESRSISADSETTSRDAKAAARGDAAPAKTSAPSDAQQLHLITPASDNTSLELADSLWRIENLHARLTELAALLNGHPSSPAPAR